jgi:hypothetical protein
MNATLRLVGVVFTSVIVTAGCGENPCGGATGAPCPPPVYARAVLQGVVFTADSQPAIDRTVAAVDCDGGSVYDAPTREDGTFSVGISFVDWGWGAAGTLPVDTAGYFTARGCRVNVSTPSKLTLRLDSVPIRFARVGRPEPVTWLELWETP